MSFVFLFLSVRTWADIQSGLKISLQSVKSLCKPNVHRIQLHSIYVTANSFDISLSGKVFFQHFEEETLKINEFGANQSNDAGRGDPLMLSIPTT